MIPLRKSDTLKGVGLIFVVATILLLSAALQSAAVRHYFGALTEKAFFESVEEFESLAGEDDKLRNLEYATTAWLAREGYRLGQLDGYARALAECSEP